MQNYEQGAASKSVFLNTLEFGEGVKLTYTGFNVYFLFIPSPIDQWACSLVLLGNFTSLIKDRGRHGGLVVKTLGLSAGKPASQVQDLRAI